VTDAQLRSLLRDCLTLWDIKGRITVRNEDIAIETASGVFAVSRAPEDMRPVRWFYQTPERATAKRPSRPTPSIVALLSALRNAMEGTGGDRLRVGGG
jgi:hypothetical protein